MPAPTSRSLRLATRALIALAVLGVGKVASAQDAPLASFTAQKVTVFPVQFLKADTTAPVKTADWAAVRKEFDDSLGAAISDRGVGKKWSYAADVIRIAKRNSAYVNDPMTLGAMGLRPPRPLKPDDQASMTLVNNLRSLTAVSDSRFALIPVELGFERRDTRMRPTLRLVIIDSLQGQVVWYADVAGDAGTGFGHAAIGSLAQRIADLISAR